MGEPLPEIVFGAQVVLEPVTAAVGEPIIDNASDQHRLLADANQAFFEVYGVAAYGIERGVRVSVQPDPLAPPGRVSEYLTSTVAALVLGQQRRFALHANAVTVAGDGVLFAGHSGAGKSTTSLRLIQRGHTHLTDDMCLLHADGDELVLDPPPRGIRFLPHTAEALDLDVSSAVASPAVEDKMVLPQPAAPPTPVRGVVFLERADILAVEMERLGTTRAIELMTTHACRRPIIQLLWPRELFAWTADIVERMPVFLLRRPESEWTIDQVADAIERVALGDYER